MDDVLVVGGGIAGSAAALALARAGAGVTLVDGRAGAQESAPRDGRTTAFLVEALQLFQRLGVWAEMAAGAAPLRRLRIVNVADGAIQGDVTFEAGELGLEAFGYNLLNHRVADVLRAALTGHSRVRLVPGRFATFARAADAVRVELEDGQALSARLLVGVDGKGSRVREAARIGVRRHEYGQAAIVGGFTHARPHGDTSIEVHRPWGPFTLVPMGDRRSSFVWVEAAAEAGRIQALDEADFRAELEARASPWLGGVTALTAKAQLWPLSAVLAARLAAPRLALAGEAAHALSPLGAQGLNLSLRDATALAELVGAALANGRDPGAPAVVLAYERRRRVDVSGRFWAVDGLNRAVRSGSPALGLARGLGLQLIGSLPPLRRGVMRSLLGGAAAG